MARTPLAGGLNTMTVAAVAEASCGIEVEQVVEEHRTTRRPLRRAGRGGDARPDGVRPNRFAKGSRRGPPSARGSPG